ncbi:MULTISPECIES: hypothetical protein [Okeania]|uniref:hypothetical protein n=1 Tax=Okeania TaxID=1458928 RepID=UPI001374A848|nr:MULTISPECIES: hypothetical protein [Okeania]NEP40687.1 hypothetical protein [Okeania sp. SIO2H7]NEP74869.1 hypothetical protein [Okeania sp. SIO2G5]NEP96841.1 hypothetical protein [Okeania sp. SIO2F5]NEQ93705.1 hypothetical protein [Okeania sp. SIO2G4]NES74795.1 hypothetical protein [Okeania sp. SIO1H4]
MILRKRQNYTPFAGVNGRQPLLYAVVCVSPDDKKLSSLSSFFFSLVRRPTHASPTDS